MRTWIVQWGWCGFGYLDAGQRGNLFPALCLGILSVAWSNDTLTNALLKTAGARDGNKN